MATFSQPIVESIKQVTSNIEILGCSESTIGFNFLQKVPAPRSRRYCNKVFVNECVELPQPYPLELDYAEFLATSDTCYEVFEIYKNSHGQPDLPPTTELPDGGVLLQYNSSGTVDGVIIQFGYNDTCNVPLRLAYKLYGYNDNVKLLLSSGNLYVTPCKNCADCEPKTYTGISW